MRIVLTLVLFVGNMGLGPATVAQAVKPAPSPQPSFSLAIATIKDVSKVGLPVSIEITKKNISDHAINNSWIRGEFTCQMDVRDDQGNVRPEAEEFRQMKKSRNANPRRTASVVLDSLQPDESRRGIGDVDRCYDLSRPGKYTIQVYETDPESKTVVKSNTITVTVAP